MNEFDLLIDGMGAYGFLLAGYALWLQLFESKYSQASPTRNTKTTAPLSVPECQIPPAGKAA